MGTLVADSSPIALDTRAPQNLTVFNIFASGTTGIFCAWSSNVSDQAFDHYEIWYGLNQSDVQNRTGTALSWDDSDDANLSTITTFITTIVGVEPGGPYYVTLFAIDQFGQEISLDASSTVNLQIELTSSDFDLDTLEPQSLASLVGVASADSIDCTWTAVTDANFNHYEVWYGTNQSDVQNRTGTAAEWDDGDDANLATAGTTSTTITSLTPGSTYFIAIWAVDDFGNETMRVDGASPITLFIPAQDDFDGEIVIYDVISAYVDGWIKVFETNPNHYFGRVYIYDFAINASDGFIHIGHDSTNNADGRVVVEERAENRLDGQIVVRDSIIENVDGVVIVYDVAMTAFDGFIEISDIVADYFDGLIRIYDVATTEYNGSIDISAVVTIVFDGAIEIFTDAAVLFDGWIYVVLASSLSYDGLLEVTGAVDKFDGSLIVEAIPRFVLFRPRQGETKVKENSTVTVEIEGYPDILGGGLDVTSLLVSMLTPELAMLYDGSDPVSYPDVLVTGNTNRLSLSFAPSFEDGLYPSDSVISFYLSIANDLEQTADVTYIFNTRTGSGVELRAADVVYEYDMGTNELNITEFNWQSDGLVKMRLKFADSLTDLRNQTFEGEERESFRGTSFDDSIWDINSPVLTISQNEVLIIEGAQVGATDIWENETRLAYVGLLPASYNIAIDMRLNIDKAAIKGARSFLEINDAVGNIIRIEKIYQGMPASNPDGTSADIVPDEAVEIRGSVNGVLSTGSIFPQTLSTAAAETVEIEITVTNNDILLSELERIRIQFGGTNPNLVDFRVNGIGNNAFGVQISAGGYFEVTGADLISNFTSGEEADRLQFVHLLFAAPATSTVIESLEVFSAAETIDTRLRIVVNGAEEYDAGVVVDPLRYDQLKADIERSVIDVQYNGESVYRRYMKLNNPRFVIGAGGRDNGDALVAEFDNLIIRRYYDRSPVPLNLSKRYAAYEITLKAPRTD